MEPLELDAWIAIEDQLSDEERATRDTVRAWVNERFLPELKHHHRAGTFPVELIPEVAELGLLGANLPEEYGCAGLNAVSYGLIMQELERGDSGLRSLASVQGALVMWPIFSYGSEEQKTKYLPQLASGKAIGCFGLTEPGSGSDPGSMKTSAVREGEHYVLNGIKTWITNSPISELAVVWAKLSQEDDSIRGFIVERGFPGFTTPTIEGKFSLRASPTGEIHLNDCRVPHENLLPNVRGLKGPLSCLTQARHGIGWGATGAAIDCFETVRTYGLERKQFARPLASFQLYQAKLADMATKILNCQLLNLHHGRLKERGQLTPVQVSAHKRHNVAAARDIARVAREMLGGIGITDAYSVIRHMMNLESVYTYEGTDDIHTLSLGRALTGLNAFS